MSDNLPAVVSAGIAVTGNYEADLEVGAKIRDAAESLQFMLGDWVLAMQEKHEESVLSLAKDMSLTTGVPAETLRQYARVSRSFPAGKRLPEASWSHHHKCADSSTPVTTLRSAIKQGLSVRDTGRLAKGLPLGGEDTAQKQSSVVVSGANMEEAVLESIALAEQHLTRALATIKQKGFRLTPAVGQDIMARLESCSKPFVNIEAAVKDEVGAFV